MEEKRDFLNCIKLFGTDFCTTQILFPFKTYNQIIKRYHKLKRSNPKLLNKFLTLHEKCQYKKEELENYMNKILNRI